MESKPHFLAKIKLSDGAIGVVRFIGYLPGKKGEFYGLDIESGLGKNNGKFDEMHCFKPQFGKKTGRFTKIKKIQQYALTDESAKYKDFHINDTVHCMSTKCDGILRYIGTPIFSNNKSNKVYVGLELKQKKGSNNGTHENKYSYFQCKNKFGIYVPFEKIRLKDNEVSDSPSSSKPKKQGKVSKGIGDINENEEYDHDNTWINVHGNDSQTSEPTVPFDHSLPETDSMREARSKIELTNISKIEQLTPNVTNDVSNTDLSIPNLKSSESIDSDIMPAPSVMSDGNSVTSSQFMSGSQSDLMAKHHSKGNSSDDRTLKEKMFAFFAILLEGDLAGFQIFWIFISIGFIFLRAIGLTDVAQRVHWEIIFFLPMGNSVLTGVFDHLIRKYQSTRAVESLAKSRFVILWLVKVGFAVYIIVQWIWGTDGLVSRLERDRDYTENAKACNCSIICIFVAMVAAVGMSELMISTVLISSEENLSVHRTPAGMRFFLFLIRPFVWVYNRTMVMFICFYAIYGAFYGFFVFGVVCDYYCESSYCGQQQKVGLELLLVPFTVPGYLFRVNKLFENWTSDSTDDNLLETFVIVFLLQSFFIDVLDATLQFTRPLIRKYIQKKDSSLSRLRVNTGVLFSDDGMSKSKNRNIFNDDDDHGQSIANLKSP